MFASVVADRDQALRLQVCGVALAIFLLMGLLIDLNAISLHGYYRTKLGEIWIHEMPKWGYRIPIRELTTTRKGGPYHLINGTLNLMRRGADASRSETARFTFSHRYCGSSRTGYARTDFYDGGKIDLADAIGISAAAVNPASVRNPLVRVLLLVLNFRLGQWVPNPSRKSMGAWWATPIRLFFNWVRYGVPEDRAYCFVTDGGHDENTAVGALLERRCRVIIAVDASQDPDYQFADFLKLIRVAVVKHGVQIVDLASDSKALSFAGLKPHEKTRLAKTHFLVARIKYPAIYNSSAPSGDCDGYLLFVKPNLTDDEPTELIHYRTENPDFPHDPTLDQFYDPLRFACYRQIGEHMGDRLCDEFFDETTWAQTREAGTWLAERWKPDLLAYKRAAEQSRGDVPDSYRASTRDALLLALWSEDDCLQERAIDVFRLKDAPAPPRKGMYRQAVDDLVVAFGIAHGRNNIGLQKAICTVIAQYAVQSSKAAAFIKEICSGRLPVPDEVREAAKASLERIGPEDATKAAR